MSDEKSDAGPFEWQLEGSTMRLCVIGTTESLRCATEFDLAKALASKQEVIARLAALLPSKAVFALPQLSQVTCASPSIDTISFCLDAIAEQRDAAQSILSWWRDWGQWCTVHGVAPGDSCPRILRENEKLRADMGAMATECDRVELYKKAYDNQCALIIRKELEGDRGIDELADMRAERDALAAQCDRATTLLEQANAQCADWKSRFSGLKESWDKCLELEMRELESVHETTVAQCNDLLNQRDYLLRERDSLNSTVVSLGKSRDALTSDRDLWKERYESAAESVYELGKELSELQAHRATKERVGAEACPNCPNEIGKGDHTCPYCDDWRLARAASQVRIQRDEALDEVVALRGENAHLIPRLLELQKENAELRKSHTFHCSKCGDSFRGEAAMTCCPSCGPTADKAIVFRGSVTDLATDVAHELTLAQGKELIEELTRSMDCERTKFRDSGKETKNGRSDGGGSSPGSDRSGQRRPDDDAHGNAGDAGCAEERSRVSRASVGCDEAGGGFHVGGAGAGDGPVEPDRIAGYGSQSDSKSVGPGSIPGQSATESAGGVEAITSAVTPEVPTNSAPAAAQGAGNFLPDVVLIPNPAVPDLVSLKRGAEAALSKAVLPDPDQPFTGYMFSDEWHVYLRTKQGYCVGIYGPYPFTKPERPFFGDLYQEPANPKRDTVSPADDPGGFWSSVHKAAETVRDAPDWQKAGINLSDNFEQSRPETD